jgi:glycosyltransferase involved in cell wall biosynthesis
MRAELPVMRLDPSNLAADLEAIFSRREEWAAIGAQSRRYVERWHDPDRIARALLSLYGDPRAPFELEAAA